MKQPLHESVQSLLRTVTAAEGERKAAERFGVSRPTLARAIAGLPLSAAVITHITVKAAEVSR